MSLASLAEQPLVSWLRLHLRSVLLEWGLTLVEGCVGAKGTPLSMWQVRVWWTGWMEIASGPEKVFMRSCQSTERPSRPISQAPVWSRHPQSREAGCSCWLPAHNSLQQKAHSKPLKYEKGHCLCNNYHSNFLRLIQGLKSVKVSSHVQLCSPWMLKKYFLLCKRPKGSGPWEIECVTYMPAEPPLSLSRGEFDLLRLAFVDQNSDNSRSRLGNMIQKDKKEKQGGNKVLWKKKKKTREKNWTNFNPCFE